MSRRQRWRKSFKSFIDPSKDEQLRGVKTEIDGNVQKIVNFLKEKVGDDRKEEVADLIKDFQKQYESLYARYDNLTGEVRDKFRGKRGKTDGASSSSDSSDSDDSVAEIEVSKEENENENSFAVDEKEALHQEYRRDVERLNDDVSLLREENSQLQFRNSELLKEKESGISDLRKVFEERESESSSRIMQLNADVNNLQEKLGHLSGYKGEADRVIEEQRGEIEKLKEELSLAENRNTELDLKIVEHEREIEEQRDEILRLREEHRDCHEKLISSEKKTEEISDQFRESMAAKIQDIDHLEETIDDLKSELEIKEDELSSLVENLRATEVKQRLSGQKLRITEQALNEQEEIHQKRVEKLIEEQKFLEERIASLSGIVSIHKEAQLNLVAELSEKMNETLNGIDTFGVKFEEDYGHLESRVFEIGNELKAVMNWITGNNAEKDEMRNEIGSLVQQVAVLTERVKEMETTLQRNGEKAKEMETMIEERDEKVGELERKINEKESGMLSLIEEKREAIRQLCIWINFHHERYEDLKDVILKKNRGGTR